MFVCYNLIVTIKLFKGNDIRSNMEFNLIEVKKNCALYKEYKTYVFIQTHTNLWNGYIISVDNDSFVFMEDEIPQPFPVRFSDLIAPVIPSKKKGKDYNWGRTNGK